MDFGRHVCPRHGGAATGGLYLFNTGSHWCLTQADPKYGVVVHHRGGTYQIKGNEDTESTEYANPSTMDAIGDNDKYSIQIPGGPSHV